MTADSTGHVAPVTIQLIPGSVAPRPDTAQMPADLIAVQVTEQGMVSGLPMVDLLCQTEDGKIIRVTTSGRMMCSIAAAIRGINMRIHGKMEP